MTASVVGIPFTRERCNVRSIDGRRTGRVPANTLVVEKTTVSKLKMNGKTTPLSAVHVARRNLRAETDQLQIMQAAHGMISGTLAEWPALKSALNNLGVIVLDDTPARELQRICASLLGEDKDE